MSTLKFWHGSQRWDGPIEIQESRSGRYEHGPGLYATVDVSVAAQYAKGPGKLILMELSPKIKLLEEVYMDFDEMKQMLQDLKHLKKKKAVLSDFENCRERTNREDRKLSATIAVNLCVNNESLSGKAGPELAQALVDKGVDASLSRFKSKDMLIIFNPKVILKSMKLSSNQAYEIGDFASYREQRLALDIIPKIPLNNTPSILKKFKP